MKMTTMMAAATLALGAAGAALADPVYPNPGTPNLASYTFEAAATGDVDLYYLSSSAGDTDIVSVTIGGTTTVAFNNHASNRGDEIVLTGVTQGESITFSMFNQNTGVTYASDSLVPDGNHLYSTSFAGDGTLPAGTFLAFEDLTKGDYDYNDVAFSATNIVAVPEPANMALLLAGLGLVGFMARRRSS